MRKGARTDDIMTDIARRKFLALAVAGASCGGRSVAQGAGGIALEGGSRLATIPFSLTDNRMFVEARINGAGPFSMIFDTGGVNVVTADVARETGLIFGKETKVGGAGAAVLPAWRTQIGAVAAGGVSMRDGGFTIVSLDQIREAIGFDRLDGLFGHELLSRFVVRVDYAGSTISFAEPDAAPPDWLDGDALDFDFARHIPRIKGTIEGREATFIIDTGDRGALSLFEPFARETGLAGSARYSAVTGWGIGGAVRSGVARFEGLTFGAQRVARVVARLPGPETGVFGTRLASCSLGGAVMKRFQTIYDYGRRRIILQPRADVASVDVLDLAGLWIVGDPGSRGRSIRVHTVDAHGPAERAGVVAGDRIDIVDGRPAAEIGAVALRQMFADGPAGRVVILGLARGGATLEARIVLSDRLA
jgi:hypothetical protein